MTYIKQAMRVLTTDLEPRSVLDVIDLADTARLYKAHEGYEDLFTSRETTFHREWSYDDEIPSYLVEFEISYVGFLTQVALKRNLVLLFQSVDDQVKGKLLLGIRCQALETRFIHEPSPTTKDVAFTFKIDRDLDCSTKEVQVTEKTQFEKIDWHKVADDVIAAQDTMLRALKAGGNNFRIPAQVARQTALETIRDHDERHTLRSAGFEVIGDQWCRIEDGRIVARSQKEAIKALFS